MGRAYTHDEILQKLDPEHCIALDAECVHNAHRVHSVEDHPFNIVTSIKLTTCRAKYQYTVSKLNYRTYFLHFFFFPLAGKQYLNTALSGKFYRMRVYVHVSSLHSLDDNQQSRMRRRKVQFESARSYSPLAKSSMTFIREMGVCVQLRRARIICALLSLPEFSRCFLFPSDSTCVYKFRVHGWCLP